MVSGVSVLLELATSCSRRSTVMPACWFRSLSLLAHVKVLSFALDINDEFAFEVSGLWLQVASHWQSAHRPPI